LAHTSALNDDPVVVVDPERFVGSQADLYLLLPDVGESDLIHQSVPDGASILELGCGTGRMTRGLLKLGHRVTAVDNDAEMLRHVPAGAESVLNDIETLDLGALYPVVLLASNLVNNSDRIVRSNLLTTCRRHVSDSGVVILERYPPDLEGWETGKWEDRGLVEVRISRFERQADQFSVSIEYRQADRSWAHHFSAALLSDETLRSELATADLRFERTLDSEGAWVLAKPS